MKWRMWNGIFYGSPDGGSWTTTTESPGATVLERLVPAGWKLWEGDWWARDPITGKWAKSDGTPPYNADLIVEDEPSMSAWSAQSAQPVQHSGLAGNGSVGTWQGPQVAPAAVIGGAKTVPGGSSPSRPAGTLLGGRNAREVVAGGIGTFLVVLLVIVLLVQVSASGGANGGGGAFSAVGANASQAPLPDPALNGAPALQDMTAPDGPPMSTVEALKTAAMSHLVFVMGGVPGKPGETIVGTGWEFSPGVIVTNDHVIRGATPLVVGRPIYAGSQPTLYPATVEMANVADDVALLRVSSNIPGLTPATIGNSNNVTDGQKVVIVGNAEGVVPFHATGGAIDSTDTPVTASGGLNGAGEVLPYTFQSDAQIWAGDSGSPLLNMNGDVIAMNTAGRDGGAVSNSIPINQVLFDLALPGHMPLPH
jgi:S1-C subfamily serine protease